MADSSNHSFDSSAFMNIFNSPEHDIWSNSNISINNAHQQHQHHHQQQQQQQQQHQQQRPFTSTNSSKVNIFNLPNQHRHSINTSAIHTINNSNPSNANSSNTTSNVNSIFNPSSISAPSSSAQRHSTPHLQYNYSNTQNIQPKGRSHSISKQPNLPPNHGMSSNSKMNATPNPQSSPTVWSNYSNTSLEDVSILNPNTSARSSRFFPSPYDANRTYDIDANNSHINSSPLIDNRRSTLPNFETSSPFHNRTTTPTPQFDSPSNNYMSYLPITGSTKNMTYSTIFEDVSNPNTQAISNSQYSNIMTTPMQNDRRNIQPSLDRNSSYPNIDYSYSNMNPINISNQPNLQLNPILMPTSSFANENENQHENNDSLMYKMDGFESNSRKHSQASNLLLTTDFSELSFVESKFDGNNNTIENNTSFLHSPSPSSSFLPQLNLKDIHQSSPIKEKHTPEPSPHTPLNQQDLMKLLQLNTDETPNTTATSIHDGVESPISPSSSSFPSPTLPTMDFFQPSKSKSPKVETKPRISHYINNMVTRHNIVYRSYIVSAPRSTPVKKSVYLIENLLYAYGTIKDIEILKSTNEEFTKMRVILIVADSQLTNSNIGQHAGDSELDREKRNEMSGPWKSIRFKLRNEEAKLLIFYENEEKDYALLNRSGLIKVLFKRDKINSIIENSVSSMTKTLTLNNKLDVCWYPEGFSSTFHRRGVNNFMFVRELQSKMIVNRTRVSGGGIIEMGEFRISMPIEEMGFSNDKLNGEKLKRSFLVNIDLKELDGKPDNETMRDKQHESKEYASSPNGNGTRGKFNKKRGGFSRGRGGRGGRG